MFRNAYFSFGLYSWPPTLCLCLGLVFAYHLRLTSGLIPCGKGFPLHEYIFPLFYLVPIWGVVGVSLGLYSPRRTFALWDEGGCWQAASLTLVCFTATSYVLKEVDISA
jgi:hypothetical protein